MQRNTEYNKYTYIYNIYTYNISPQLLTTSRSTTRNTTKADGNRTDSAPTTNRRTADNAGNVPELDRCRKSAKNGAIYSPCRPSPAHRRTATVGNRRKSTRNQPIKNVKKCYNITFFLKSLLFR